MPVRVRVRRSLPPRGPVHHSAGPIAGSADAASARNAAAIRPCGRSGWSHVVPRGQLLGIVEGRSRQDVAH
eukprot:6472808-Prorocentrum_lima.AAC.1